ncbi:hypothetical protein PAMP_021362 [Pampus punctatissimus]
MFSAAAAKMSVEASDVQTDEDCEELQTTRRKKSSGKPPSSPRSPYLSSLNVNPRRTAVAAWRLPRASLGDTRGETPGDTGSARLTSLSNGHDLSQMLRSECDVTPELLKQTLTTRKHKHLHSASNGFSFSSGDYREKEDMYDEIIRLKKSLQAQKSDNQKMKAKLRRLEGDNAKREKQIEELLDPTKVLNGLKQRILKLEQQCREKENALSSRAESKCSQRQQKALSSTVLRLSENLKQLQQENATLKEELSTESPAGGIKGYRDWSKQRLLRRLFEVEKRLEDSRKHAHRAKDGGRLDQEVQVTPTEILEVAQGVAVATEAVVSVGTITEEGEELYDLRGRLSKLETERAELQETLSSKDDEVRQLRTEREELKEEAERWKAEGDKERQQHKQELEQLTVRIQTLEEDRSKLAQAEVSSLSPTTQENQEDTQDRADVEEGEETDTGGKEKEEGAEKRRQKKREKAASIIQTNWREYRNRDIVMLQSALRGHLLRESQLKGLQKKVVEATNRSDVASLIEGELDVVALTMIQSTFRGHLARCSLAIESSGFSEPSPLSLPTLVPRRARSTHTPSRTGAASLINSGEEEDLWPVSSTHTSSMTPTTAQTELQCTAESGGAAAVDSDDSDDIIVSPSRPLRSREVLMS